MSRGRLRLDSLRCAAYYFQCTDINSLMMDTIHPFEVRYQSVFDLIRLLRARFARQTRIHHGHYVLLLKLYVLVCAVLSTPLVSAQSLRIQLVFPLFPLVHSGAFLAFVWLTLGRWA